MFCSGFYYKVRILWGKGMRMEVGVNEDLVEFGWYAEADDDCGLLVN